MEDLSDVGENRQKMVYFDVSGTVFRVFRDTIQNYPSSLLAKLINEFPNLGDEAKPLFVDRSPKAFEWIREIYRNGDFATCVPACSRAVLNRELDFYQLPGLAHLGLSELGYFNEEAEAAYNCPGKALLEALTARNLWNSLPLFVWFYRTSPNQQMEYGRDLVWFSEQPRADSQLFKSTSLTPLFLPVKASEFERERTWLTTRNQQLGGAYFMIRNPNVPSVCRTLQQSAEKYGLCLELPERCLQQSEPRPSGFPPGLLVSIARRNH